MIFAERMDKHEIGKKIDFNAGSGGAAILGNRRISYNSSRGDNGGLHVGRLKEQNFFQ